MTHIDRQLFTVTIYSENLIGLLSQITNIFTRRGVNIESLTASPTSIARISKITVTANDMRPNMELVVRLIEKRIDVLRAFLYTDDDILYQEVALFKVPTDRLLAERHLEQIIRRHNVRILEITPDYTALEKTGHSDETEALFEELKRYDIRQFVRSGRVCITKSKTEFVDRFLEEQEERRQHLLDQLKDGED